MTTEEKAKRYDEALEKMKSMLTSWETLSYNGKTFLQDLESIFPELRESEDEKVRKELIEFVKSRGGFKHEYIAWLEKQGNQREQLINKACDVLVNCIEDYMLRRMEVWNEESKKQTL